MRRLLWFTAAMAAGMLIVGSATINAMFLASGGRTELEATVYAGVSIAADMAKVVLPVAIVRAVIARQRLTASLCGVMLTTVIALSLASGAGFAALTRGTVTAGRDAAAGQLAALESDRARLLERVTVLASARELAVVTAALESMMADRRWQTSRRCTDVASLQSRQFCSDVHQLRVELVTASERVRLLQEEHALRSRIETLRFTGAGVAADPQAEALAALIHAKPERVRGALGLMMALVMELGAIVLVVLLAGPLLRKPQKAEEPKTVPPEPVKAGVELPPQIDRSYWHRQRQLREVRAIGGADDATR
jgi:hypothetical protein